MPMSDGKNQLQKIKFQLGAREFKFAINPENYTHAKPHRTTAVKTKSRVVIEDFQSDIPTITIGGTTGFNPTGKVADRGINKIKEMKKYLEDYADMGGNGNTSAEDFYFHNYTNDESFVVHLAPEGVTYTQDVSQPLLFKYEIKFIVLRKATEPAEGDIINPEIGNRYPSIILPSPIHSPLVPLPGASSSSPNTGTGSGEKPYDPSSGNGNIYNSGSTGPYVPNNGSAPINPQVPSPTAYQYGQTGLGLIIGYYGRSYK